MDFSTLRAKFFAATVALFAIAGIVSVFMATRSLDRLGAIITSGETALKQAQAAQQEALIATLKAEQAAEQTEIKIANTRDLNTKQKEIATKEAALRGFYEGALRVIAAQLDTALEPLSAEDRARYALDDKGYLSVMDGAKSVSFFAAPDADTLAEIAKTQDLSPVRVGELETALRQDSSAAKPHMANDFAEKAIRIIANVGPADGRYGLVEIVLDDKLSPIKAAAGDLAMTFFQRLSEQSSAQKKKFEARQAELDARKAAAEADSAERAAQTDGEERSARNWLIGVVVLSSLFGAITISALVVILITRPLSRNVTIMSRLADNDTDVEITDADRKDEIGEMAKAVQVFKESLIEAERQAEERRAERAARDERVRRIEAMAMAVREMRCFFMR